MTEEEPPDVDFEIKELPPEEEARLALSTPSGRTVTEIADAHDISADVVREEAVKRIRDKDILAKTDGEEDGNPRLYRNPLNSLFARVWVLYAELDGPGELDEHIAEQEAKIEEFQEKTGYDHPDALVDDFGETDLSYIETPDTGELFWDVVTPWSTAIQGKRVAEFVRDNYELLDNWAGRRTDLEVTGRYGDFSDHNAVEDVLDVDD